MKICKKCNEQKELKDFVKSNLTIDGTLNTCKLCDSKRKLNIKYDVSVIEKKCFCCKITKNAQEFPKNKGLIGGLHTWCKECCKRKNKENEYYKNSKKVRNEKRKVDPLFREKLNKQSKKSRIKNIETYLLRNCRIRAKQKNLEFDLQKEDIVIPEYCPILLTKLECGTKENYTNSPSVDRIDNTKGYIKGNVQVISTKANKIKNEATIAELILLSEWINKTFINN